MGRRTLTSKKAPKRRKSKAKESVTKKFFDKFSGYVLFALIGLVVFGDALATILQSNKCKPGYRNG